jgi:hypothetical protein
MNRIFLLSITLRGHTTSLTTCKDNKKKYHNKKGPGMPFNTVFVPQANIF